MNWQVLYPGMRLVEASPEADEWSQALGILFHEARVECNGHNLSLVFSDVDVSVIEPGFAPFVVPAGGPDHKVPLA